jgi:hypothetical protein
MESNERLIINLTNKEKIIWKEGVMVYVMSYPTILLRKRRKSRKILVNTDDIL